MGWAFIKYNNHNPGGTMRISKFTRTAVASAVCSGALLSVSMPAQANKDLERLSKEDTNWVMQT